MGTHVGWGGVLNQYPTAPRVDLHDTRSLLVSLRCLGGYVIVQCEDAGEDDEDFYIGNILRVDERSIEFANFDTLGRWDEEVYTIPLEEITKTEWDTPYIRVFSKYLSDCPLTP